MGNSAHSNTTINEHPDRIRSFGPHSYGQNNINVYYWKDGCVDKKGDIIEDVFVDVGKFCSISGGQLYILGGIHNSENISTFPFGKIFQDKFNKYNGIGHPYTKGGIKIGNDVYLSTDVTIHSGVTVGDGAVIGSNAVVTKDIPPYAIVGGVPARVIKYRFDEETIEKLLELKWWEMSDEHVNELTPLLSSNKIEDFIKRATELKEGTGPQSDEWLETDFLK